jgi:DNA polymerase-1
MLLIVDGNNFVYRAFAKIEKDPIVNARGENITGLYMSIEMIRELIKRFDETEEIIFVWDGKESKAKKSIYPNYKANRKDSSYADEVRKQIPLIRNSIIHLGVKQIRFEHIEADDVIGVLSNAFTFIRREHVIVTNDKDMLQLVTPCCSVFSAIKQKLVTAENFERIFGFPVEGFVDFLIMLGDTTDNIIGIYGIGEKWAKKIIKKYTTIENLKKDRENVEMLINIGEQSKTFAKKMLLVINADINLLEINKKLIVLGFLLDIEDKKQIIREYYWQKVQFDKVAIGNIFDYYQMIEHKAQIPDIEHCLKSMDYAKQTKTYAF